MTWNHLPIVAFDIETTGLMPSRDRIMEFSAVVFRVGPDGRIVSEERYSWRVNPGVSIPSEVSALPGISDHDVADKPPFSDVAASIHGLLAGAITVAHNYEFDKGFLTHEFDRCGLPWPKVVVEVDTMKLSMRRFIDARDHRLGALCEQLGVPLTGQSAEESALAVGKCFIEMARIDAVEDDIDALRTWANMV